MSDHGVTVGPRAPTAPRVPRPTKRARVVAATVAVVCGSLLAGCTAPPGTPAKSAKSAAPATPAASSTPRFRVTGYAEAGGTTPARLSASAGVVTMVGVDGVNLTASGDGISPVSPPALALLSESHRLHATAELLVGNFSGDTGDFDDALAEKMFASPAHIASVVAALVAEVQRDRWDGVTVDLEGLNHWGADGHTGDDNAGLTAFVKTLKSALGARSVSVAITAAPGSYRDLGYDLPALAGAADHLVLMAYDQHGPTWSTPGPVGGTPWVTASLKSLLRDVPEKSRIQLGIAGYGYDWPGDGSDGIQFSDAEARAFVSRARGIPRWDATQQEWHASLADGTTIWWSDARTYRARLALAKSLGLGGVAVWSLAASDPLE